ncbi:biotin-dependent carboxyltransferase family protein [Pseudobacter ginsenosidimutans]|uniref:Antagonist of KipI n=1 Tax=Pseudobacter ginsenosidimutans TaxID=661488 RepID=A0A4Q7N3T1_9BACT|nr:biotin-dependent carboxyltransferase family protein [Pseudobacter ginsenosidimutans]QEC44178.1 biotin-dependent carboxyltransferase family protein [Pseudobacter ginsenosidimutans]RZS75628.1 antagonist of KipI [Pseudobacter ginsenosidimutans]
MSLTIIKPGLCDTIQDAGRHGQAHLGINAGGAMDTYAAGVANLLAGNQRCEAVLEVHFPGPQILFEQNALISITGGDFTPYLNDEPLPLWRPIVVRRNTILHFDKLQQGARCYIAIHGGFNVEPWLGSYSTNLKAGAGGYEGRKLAKGDELCFRENTVYFAGLLKEGKDFQVLNWRVDMRRIYENPHEICFTCGHEFSELCPNSQQDLLQNNFIIHPFSDRMGYRLKGVPLKRKHDYELISSGVGFGTMQLLPDGQLIVLMADHQTTGGYPRIGHIVSAHLPKLAQLRPSDTIQFKRVDIQTAEDLLYSQQQEMVILQRACHDHLNELVC